MSGGRARAGSGASAREPPASPAPDASSARGPSAESFKKLDQIIQVSLLPSGLGLLRRLKPRLKANQGSPQNFHTKAASVILDSRMNLKTTSANKGSANRKVNKWVCRLLVADPRSSLEIFHLTLPRFLVPT